MTNSIILSRNAVSWLPFLRICVVRWGWNPGWAQCSCDVEGRWQSRLVSPAAAAPTFHFIYILVFSKTRSLSGLNSLGKSAAQLVQGIHYSPLLEWATIPPPPPLCEFWDCTQVLIHVWQIPEQLSYLSSSYFLKFWYIEQRTAVVEEQNRNHATFYNAKVNYVTSFMLWEIKGRKVKGKKDI